MAGFGVKKTAVLMLKWWWDPPPVLTSKHSLPVPFAHAMFCFVSPGYHDATEEEASHMGYGIYTDGAYGPQPATGYYANSGLTQSPYTTQSPYAYTPSYMTNRNYCAPPPSNPGFARTAPPLPPPQAPSLMQPYKTEPYPSPMSNGPYSYHPLPPAAQY